MGTPEDQATQFPPTDHRQYLLRRNEDPQLLFSSLTPQGNILIDSTYERNVPTIEKSVTQLGFKFSDTKILLGTTHMCDHQEGDALVKQQTGAQVMAMAEDVPALKPSNLAAKSIPLTRCCTTESR